MAPSVSLIQSHTYHLETLSYDLERVLAPLGGMAAFVTPGDRVLLKPNLLTGGCPGKECITRPELVYGVARMVQALGGHPFMRDSPAFGTAMGVAQTNGYLPLLKELQIPVVEFQGQRYRTMSETFEHLRLSREAMTADVVINLPKVKSHIQLTLTLGVKNLFGCVPGKMKAWWHLEAGKDANRFGEMLVETARAIAPDLTLLDGIIGHEGNGPSGGEPRPLGILAASAHVFALDRVMTDILQVDPLSVPTIAASERLGLVPDLDSITFPHCHPQDLRVQDWQLSQKMMPIDFGAPRILRSALKHLYIRWLKEPLAVYANR